MLAPLDPSTPIRPLGPTACPNRRRRRPARMTGAALVALALSTATLAACSSPKTETVTDSGTTVPAGDSTPTTAAGGSPTTDGGVNHGSTSGLKAPYHSVFATTAGTLNIYAKPGDTKAASTLPSKQTIPGSKETIDTVLLEKSPEADGFMEVYLPVKPNGSTGFVKVSDVRTQEHNYRIDVKLSEFKLTVYNGDEVFLDTKIATAKGNTPTPGGTYYINQLLKPLEANSVYGTYAYGLSGHSESAEVLKEFGEGQLGIHGTNEPQLIGQSVSHGCIRMLNKDIDKLAATLPLGVPVIIEP